MSAGKKNEAAQTTIGKRTREAPQSLGFCEVDSMRYGQGSASCRSSPPQTAGPRGIEKHSDSRCYLSYLKDLLGYGGAGGTERGSFLISSSRYWIAASSWASLPSKVAWGRLSTVMSGSTPWPSISHLPSGP